MSMIDQWRELRVLCWHLVVIVGDEIAHQAEKQIDRIHGGQS